MDLLTLGKRKVEGDGFELREVKRVRGGDNVKRVAEIVLILASIGKIRGGKLPSEVEKELMVEVREKLAEVCQDFAPKDVFPRDLFGGVIEDLGLGKFKEQRLGFKGPKISIAEKLLLSKRKFQIEKSEDFSLPPLSAPQRLQGATPFDNHGPSLPARVNTQDKPGQRHAPSASGQPSAWGPVVAANSTPSPLLYQLPTSEVRAGVLNSVPTCHPSKDSFSSPLARVDQPSLSVGGRPTGSSHSLASQVQPQVASTWNQTMGRPPAFPVQHQSFSSTQRSSDNRSMPTAQFEGPLAIKSGIATQPATTMSLTTQVTTKNQPTLQQSVQSKFVVQASHTRISHAEVSNIVQKFLKQHQEHHRWTPPSRSYINEALTCQMCHSTVTDVDSILICDNCEKGYHIKCLHTADHKGAVKGEWHCLRCLGANHGKPLPPKYGRVMRNQKSVGPSPDKNGIIDAKPNVQEVTANGKIVIQKGPPEIDRSSTSQQTPESKIQNAFPMHSDEDFSNEGETEKVTSGSYLVKSLSAAHLRPSQQPAHEKSLVTSIPRPLSNFDISLSMENHSQPLGDQSKFPSDGEHCGRVPSQSNLQKEFKRVDLGAVLVNQAEVATSTSMSSESVTSLSGHSSGFDWVGKASEVVDGRIYYRSCCINGVVYKVHDHVRIRYDNDKLTPSKLQAMWEDRITRMKWVMVNRCYFPSDLPEAVGRPCGLDSSEVYESACGNALEASLIQGPCDVLPPNKYEAEKERRACSGTKGDYSSRPCYVCKWIYDESKGLFRDASC